jgi:tetraacyldisaccharide 4'-kinase
MIFSRHIPRPYLLPLVPVYGLVVMIRNWLFDLHILRSVSFSIPIVSIGNITVGGTGKTPHVEYLIRLLKEKNSIAVLSRGYMRTTNNFILASELSGVKEVGDEPLQMKRKFPDVEVAVDRKRVSGIMKLRECIPGLKIIILDDAYQHRYVQPGLSVLLIDYNRPLFKDILLPAGNLREPRRNIKRAKMILVTKCAENMSKDEAEDFIRQLKPHQNQYVFFTSYVYGSPISVFSINAGASLNLIPPKSRILVVTGIAAPQPFIQYLQKNMCVEKTFQFPDHHNFSAADLEPIRNAFYAIESADKYIVTTEKDALRIKETYFPDNLWLHNWYYIPVRVEFLFDEAAVFMKNMLDFINQPLIQHP